jgi:hypothetical protein
MAVGYGEQIERRVTHRWQKWINESDKPWRNICKRSGRYKFMKRSKAKFERRKAKLNPECFPTYNKYRGWEY